MLSLPSYIRHCFKKFSPSGVNLNNNNPRSDVHDRAHCNGVQSNGYSRHRPCHFTRLFVTHRGDVFPCCLTWGSAEMKIGSIRDDDLLEKIKNFSQDCHCHNFDLRKGHCGETIDIEEINIELSLECQGQCALCCVNSPEWVGSFDLYDPLMRLVALLKPRRILVQGGEVLIQEKSLQWLEALKRQYPLIEISCVTNGNVAISMIPRIERIFDELKVSFLAFEPETYKRITGLDMKRAIAFVERLARRKRVRLLLKYLVTPLGMHEAGLFLEWAIALNPAYAFFEDAQTRRYINVETSDRFWDKISQRTGESIRSVLIAHKQKLLKTPMTIRFSTESLRVLGMINSWEAFIKDHDLQEKLLLY